MARKKKQPSALHERILEKIGGVSTGKIAAVVVGSVAILVTVLVVAVKARRHVENDERFYFDQWALTLDNLPWWVTTEIQDDIFSGFDFGGERVSLFDDNAREKVRLALQGSPWVVNATDIDLVYPTSERLGEIKAGLVLSPPLALVQIGDDAYLTDLQGRRMGDPYYPDQAQEGFGLPKIIGVRGTHRIPVHGEPWVARDIQEGLVVAKVLYNAGIQNEFPQFAISAIDVSNAEGRVEPKESEIDLIYGARIFEWGRSPHASGSQVLPISKKLENLRQVLSDPRFEHVRVVSLFTSPLVGS